MKQLLFFVYLFVITTISAQYSGTILERNNVSAYISNGGDQFFNPNSGGGYLVPKDDGIKAIYSARFLYAGRDSQGMLHTSFGGSLGLGMGTDVFVGPFATDYSDPTYQDQWNTCIYQICQEEIDVFNTWWECQNGLPNPDCASMITPSVELINKIYSWPCHGNVTIGQAYYILPFHDRDQDGIYNPDNGDYPLIKGCCGTYVIQNDSKGVHTYSGTEPVGLEMQYYFYQYSTNDYLNDVTFVDVTTINRGTVTYPEFRHGMYIDGDLGNFGDDFIGSDSVRNMAFFYNADNFDQPDAGQPGYGEAPPALGIVGLEDSLNAVVRYFSAGSVETWYDLLAGYDNGLPQQHPDGYYTSYAYSGNPLDPTQWSEVSAGNNTSERRLVLGSNRDWLIPGDTVKQTYAIIYGRSTNNLESVQTLKMIADSVKDFFDNSASVDCIGSVLEIPAIETTKISIFPNPTMDLVHVEVNSIISEIALHDINGKTLNVGLKLDKNSAEIDLSQYNPGVYILRVRINNEISYKKLIKE